MIAYQGKCHDCGHVLGDGLRTQTVLHLEPNYTLHNKYVCCITNFSSAP